MIHVAFFGDSICVGQFVSPHATWVVQLSRKLEGEFGDQIWVNNASHSGDTTRIGLERMAFDVCSHGVDVLYIQFGLNDCNFWTTDSGCARVGADTFNANMVEMIERGRAAGATQVMIATNHPCLRSDKMTGQDFAYRESNAMYNKRIREVSKIAGVELIDVETEFVRSGAELKELLLPDGIHLSRAGHNAYVDLLTQPVFAAVKHTLRETGRVSPGHESGDRGGR